MLRLAHLTDIHLDHPGTALPLADALRASGAEGAVISGDIANGATFTHYLQELAECSGLPLYFVLGNHDLYDSSLDASLRQALDTHGADYDPGSVSWLRVAPVVELGDGVALVGIDGLYDAGYGRPEGMNLNDFAQIADFRGLHRLRVAEMVQEWGRETAGRGREMLRAACATHHRVFFVTHVPPFPQVVQRKAGVQPTPESLAWYCSRSMGQMLLAEADARPEVEIVVLCGHTHTEMEAQVTPNLRVMVGGAAYGVTTVSRLFNEWPGMVRTPAGAPSAPGD